MKYKKWEIKFFIDWWFIKKWEIVWMTTYKQEVSKKENGWKKEIVDINLYFIQTWDFKKYIWSEQIIFQKTEKDLFDTKIECYKLLDKTKTA